MLSFCAFLELISQQKFGIRILQLSAEGSNLNVAVPTLHPKIVQEFVDKDAVN